MVAEFFADSAGQISKSFPDNRLGAFRLQALQGDRSMSENGFFPTGRKAPEEEMAALRRACVPPGGTVRMPLYATFDIARLLSRVGTIEHLPLARFSLSLSQSGGLRIKVGIIDRLASYLPQMRSVQCESGGGFH